MGRIEEMDLKMIRFAPIPKCASRTLKVHGLLGEADGREHSKVTEYPDWEKCEWYAIERDEWNWYPSYWHQAKQNPDSFTKAVGLKFESMANDLGVLRNPPEISFERPKGVNNWIPINFNSAYAPFKGDFYGFCRATILDGVQCIPIQIKNLDSWLIERSLHPFHMYKRAA